VSAGPMTADRPTSFVFTCWVASSSRSASRCWRHRSTKSGPGSASDVPT
jgi:hypothetical protein